MCGDRMKQQELTLLNLGNSLDDLANLDPRGYGVCKLLYKASRKYTGKPLCVNSAGKLAATIKENDLVLIMTGFILLPSEKPETDGAVGSALLARALVKAFGARPVIICPEDCVSAFGKLSECVGTEFGVIPFTKSKSEAEECADKIISQGLPKAVISIECPGENSKGVYHNAKGADVTAFEAKQDILFEKLRDKGVLNIAIGDLGNEIGMGTIGDYIKEKIPYAGENRCNCVCGGGIAVRTKADNIITATVSDWGCYSMIAMLAYILEDPDIMHSAELEEKTILTASNSGMVDMDGHLRPAIDGFGLEINRLIVSLMNELINNAIRLRESCKSWFDKVTELNCFEKF